MNRPNRVAWARIKQEGQYGPAATAKPRLYGYLICGRHTCPNLADSLANIACAFETLADAERIPLSGKQTYYSPDLT
jgi:hypothetical protein